jgi:Zn-dependent oligopeptidase
VQAAEMFNKGFETIEYTACALIDMAMHQVVDAPGS